MHSSRATAWLSWLICDSLFWLERVVSHKAIEWHRQILACASSIKQRILGQYFQVKMCWLPNSTSFKAFAYQGMTVLRTVFMTNSRSSKRVSIRPEFQIPLCDILERRTELSTSIYLSIIYLPILSISLPIYLIHLYLPIIYLIFRLSLSIYIYLCMFDSLNMYLVTYFNCYFF